MNFLPLERYSAIFDKAYDTDCKSDPIVGHPNFMCNLNISISGTNKAT